MKAWKNFPGCAPTWPLPVFEVNSDGVPVAEAGIAASGVTPVTGQFTAVGDSGILLPIAGRPFFIGTKSSGWSTGGVLQVQKSGDGTIWFDVTNQVLDGVYQSLVVGLCLFTVEYEAGMRYKLACTSYAAGAAVYRLSQ